MIGTSESIGAGKTKHKQVVEVNFSFFFLYVMIGKCYITWTPCRKWAGLSDKSDRDKWPPVVYIRESVSSLKQKKISQPHCGDIRHKPWDAQLGVGWGQEKVVDACQLQRFRPLSSFWRVCTCVFCAMCVMHVQMWILARKYTCIHASTCKCEGQRSTPVIFLNSSLP